MDVSESTIHVLGVDVDILAFNAPWKFYSSRSANCESHHIPCNSYQSR